MIVTKEQEAKFLIRKNCWTIQPDQNGDFKMVFSPLHWKEGMEVFEYREECEAALKERIEARMSSGKCPRCNLRSLDRTTRDITGLGLIKSTTTGSFYLCDICETTWYKIDSSNEAFAYDKSIAPYIIDWSERSLKILPEFKHVLDQIGNISGDDTQMIYPAHVTLKNGFELTHGLIRLDKLPPTSSWLNKRNWHYLDQVKDIKPSRYAYPFPIAKLIKSDPHIFIFIKSETSDDILRFEAGAGVFMPEELTGQQFTLLDPSTIDHSSSHIKVIYEVADRGGPDLWSYAPPPKPVIILGRLE